MKIITSLAPNRSVAQYLATNSWLDLGFDIISINDPCEIQFLKSNYPNVCFKEYSVPLKELPYIRIPIKQIISEALCHENSWIVNSDIILKSTKQDIDNINKMSSYGLIFGSRIDINEAEEEKYEAGFDFFVIHQKFSYLFQFNNTGLKFGMPWWDFWLPLLFIRKKCDIYYYNRPIAYHHIHDLNWNMDHFYQNACIVAKECGLNVDLDRNDAHIFANFVYNNIRNKSKCLN